MEDNSGCGSSPERMHDPLHDAFIRFRRGEYNAKIDAKIKEKGQRILDLYNPSKLRKSRINTHSIFWMIASISVFYYTDFYVAIKVDPNVNWSWLYPGLSLLSISICIGLFCIIWCHYIKGVSDYDILYPLAVPVATVSFLSGMACCCVALWPIWGWFTPLILFTLFMGVVFATSVLPI